jgi:hypothetical protein
MRVDNRVNQPPPARHRDNEATSRNANNGPNRTRADLPAEPYRRRSNAGGPSQQGTWRVSDTSMIATSRNAPSTLEILSSAVSRIRKDFTSSAPPGKVPSPWQR